MSDPLFDNLTPAQREAVEHAEGPLLILAGPGSGKTRVVTHRVARLLQKGVPPTQILALTFTNKAADEMRARLERMVPHAGIWMGTFHRFCARLLRKHADQVGLRENFTIYDSDDSLRTIKRTVRQHGMKLEVTSVDEVARRISSAKNNLITHQRYRPRRGDPVGAVAARVYPAYQGDLLASNAVDFDDLLLHVAVLLRENATLRSELDSRFRFILVDEYQDTNLAQYGIVRALAINYPNLAVTGDPDQSIYGWRGAHLRNILDFEKDFPAARVVLLEENYRSTPNILHVADDLIAFNVHRKHKALYSPKPPGKPVRLTTYSTQRHEAEDIAAQIAHQIHEGRRPRDFAVFYRVNALSRPLEDALRIQGVPYQVVSGYEFYQRAEIRNVLAYLQLINNPRDNAAFLRIVNVPARGIGKLTLSRLSEAAHLGSGSLLETARRAGLVPSLGKRATLSLAQFVTMCDRLRESAWGSVEDLLQRVLSETGYREHLRDLSTEEDQQRLANIEELLTVAREFDMREGNEAHLEAFLEQTSLVNDTDDWQAEEDRVSLMTLHAAKGLEFPVVFIIAFEQGLLPHERSQDDPQQLEEERRLLFVGITRAEDELQLSLARRRTFRGKEGLPAPSPFAIELPRAEMQLVGSQTLTSEDIPHGDDVAPAAPVWTEDEFVQEAPAEDEPTTRSAALPIMTAAEMLQRTRTDSSEPPTTGQYRAGMVVVHPEHGVGRILRLSGEGRKQTATIDFARAGHRTIRLAFTSLQPTPP